MMTLTPRQQAALDAITDHLDGEGVPPSATELARRLGIRHSAAQKLLRSLADKQVLTLLPGKARGIRLAASSRPSLLHLPLLGRVAAGLPIGADAEFGEVRVFDAATFSPTPDYLLRVKGNSMEGDGIFGGDLIAVKRSATADHGQIVVARLDGEITVKRLELRDNRLRLMPRHPDHAPIEIPPGSDFGIEGVYCGLLRSA